jgi:hypothetical protein
MSGTCLYRFKADIASAYFKTRLGSGLDKKIRTRENPRLEKNPDSSLRKLGLDF